MEITSEYSSWFIIWCAVLAGLYTFILYRKNSQLNELPSWVVYTLSGLRFFSVFIISILLINPLVQKWVIETEEPIVILAQDNSESILNNKDSLFYKNTYPNKINELISEIEGNYQVVKMPFGLNVLPENTEIDYSEKRTSYSNLFSEIEARYPGDKVAALILPSDGLYNIGVNPKYYSFKNIYPVYTIGLGDSTLKSDMGITEAISNEIVYLGNEFLVRVGVTAKMLKGRDAKLQVFKSGQKVSERNLKITSENQFFSEEFVFKADAAGMQRYTIKVTEYENELNIINNTSQILIDVIDNRDKVLILANAPHPDVASLRSALEIKENIEVEVALISDMEKVYNSYSLIIAHGFASPSNSRIWKKVWESKVPVLAILSSNTNAGSLRDFDKGFSTSGKKGKPNQMTSTVNEGFNGFKLSTELEKFLQDCPPILSPFMEIDGVQASRVSLYQKLGKLETEIPLCYFDFRDDIKTGWFFGEGLWKWKFYDYQENQNQDNFNAYIGKVVQYLSVKEDRSRFRIDSKRRFNESEVVKMKAEFYDLSYELVNEDEVRLKVLNEANQEFDFVFNPTGNTYFLNLGKLKAGVYNYEAEVVSKGERFIKKGSFIVNPINVEWERVSADFIVLNNLSELTNGKFYSKENMMQLAAEFSDKSKFPAKEYSSEIKQSILHEKWIFFFVLVLLSVEWFLRKYKGRY